MKEYTKRRNLNRGYMKLQVWNLGMDLFEYCNKLTSGMNLEFKLKSQLLNASLSIPSNIAEGYCRKSINEYLQFLYISLGSSGELFTRVMGLKSMRLILESDIEEFDRLHFELENKLLALIKSLQNKKQYGTWDNRVHEPEPDYSNVTEDGLAE